MKTFFQRLSEEQITISSQLTDLAIHLYINKSHEDRLRNDDLTTSAASYLRYKHSALNNFIGAKHLEIPWIEDRAHFNKVEIIEKMTAFILNLRISLDLLVCLVECIMRGSLPAFNETYPSITQNTHKGELNKIYKGIMKKPWFEGVSQSRHQLIHKGCHLSCSNEYRYLNENVNNPQRYFNYKLVRFKAVPDSGTSQFMIKTGSTQKILKILNLEDAFFEYLADIKLYESRLYNEALKAHKILPITTGLSEYHFSKFSVVKTSAPS
tara:strand:- start:1053 stop:1853 length:801 start_codon:yes stop_codon:yes gene_type:complete